VPPEGLQLHGNAIMSCRVKIRRQGWVTVSRNIHYVHLYRLGRQAANYPIETFRSLNKESCCRLSGYRDFLSGHPIPNIRLNRPMRAALGNRESASWPPVVLDLPVVDSINDCSLAQNRKNWLGWELGEETTRQLCKYKRRASDNETQCPADADSQCTVWHKWAFGRGEL
jgi:hypothetical protein